MSVRRTGKELGNGVQGGEKRGHTSFGAVTAVLTGLKSAGEDILADELILSKEGRLRRTGKNGTIRIWKRISTFTKAGRGPSRPLHLTSIG